MKGRNNIKHIGSSTIATRHRPANSKRANAAGLVRSAPHSAHSVGWALAQSCLHFAQRKREARNIGPTIGETNSIGMIPQHPLRMPIRMFQPKIACSASPPATSTTNSTPMNGSDPRSRPHALSVESFEAVIDLRQSAVSGPVKRTNIDRRRAAFSSACRARCVSARSRVAIACQ